MTDFYFALTNPEATDLLKKEVQGQYPDFKLGYSRPGFLTFKGPQHLEFSPWFSRLSGKSLGKFTFNELNYSKAWAWKLKDELQLPSALKTLSDNTLFKIGEIAILIMMIGPDEYWVGEYKLKSTHFQTPGEVSSIEEREVPSRAYYKIAEVAEAFDLIFSPNEIVLELGSAPGGASLFFLEQELRVIGVDPAEMDTAILKNKNFKHLRRPFETLRPRDLPTNIDWIVSDINLPPTVVMKEIDRFLTFLNPKGLILTLKINDEKHLNVLYRAVNYFKLEGYKRVELKYLPSHRQEIALIALRS